jgi:hypothetical protein
LALLRGLGGAELRRHRLVLDLFILRLKLRAGLIAASVWMSARRFLL